MIPRAPRGADADTSVSWRVDETRPPLTTALVGPRIDGPRLIERIETLAPVGGIDLEGRPVPDGVAPAGSSWLAPTDPRITR